MRTILRDYTRPAGCCYRFFFFFFLFRIPSPITSSVARAEPLRLFTPNLNWGPLFPSFLFVLSTWPTSFRSWTTNTLPSTVPCKRKKILAPKTLCDISFNITVVESEKKNKNTTFTFHHRRQSLLITYVLLWHKYDWKRHNYCI